MSITFVCPYCQASGKAPDRLAGRHAACPKCNNTIAVPPAPPPSNGAPPEPPPYEAYEAEERTDSTPQLVAAVVRMALWGFCLVGIVIVAVVFFDGWGRANNVMQQSAVGVQACFLLMAGFFFIYGLDRLLLGRR